MTVQELKDLIARGAARPGVNDAVELMRLSQELDRQARELVEIYGAVSTSAVAGNCPPTACCAIAVRKQ
jgi:hypothetical protein